MFRPSHVVLLGLALTACSPDRTPTWAADTVHVQPAVDGDGLVGFQTWTVYGPRWADAPNERFYACAIVIQLDLTACDTCDCADCDRTWTAVETARDSDCDTAPDALPVLTGFGTGALPASLEGDDRHAGATVGSFVQYDQGDWLAHGWVESDADDDPAAASTLTAWPAWAWPL